MKKRLYLSIVNFLLFSIACIGQPEPEIISEYSITMKGGVLYPSKWNGINSGQPNSGQPVNAFINDSNDKRDMVPIINKSTKEFAILLIDTKSVSGLFYNSTFELVTGKTISYLDKAHNQVLGGFAKHEGYCVIMANSKETSFSSITYDLRTREFVTHDFTDLTLEKEKIIDTYALDETFLVLTAVKAKSVLKAYLFKENQFEVKVFDFTGNSFNDTSHDLYKTLIGDGGVSSIYEEAYNGLELASSKRKIFHSGEEVLITIDDSDVRTQGQTRLITLNIKSGKSTIKFIKHPVVSNPYFLTNSFIFDSLIFQIVACKDELALSVSNLETLKTITNFRFAKDEIITFKNSPIYQEGSMYFSSLEKEYDNTKKFLNKITSGGSNIGVAVNQQGDKYIELIIGATKTFQTSPNAGGFSPGSTINTPYGNITTPPSYNPTSYGYQSYTTDRTTYFKSILESDSLSATKEKEVENAFDEIKAYEKGSDIARTVFKINNDFILGYYNKSNKTYNLIRFR